MGNKRELEIAFDYPLYEALAHRRVRRFGLGYHLDDGTFRFHSDKQPVPLSDTETALLAWAGDGVSGLTLAEAQVSTSVHSKWSGKVHPCPCNDQSSRLMIVNDDGVFAYEPPDATCVVEIEKAEDREKILQVYRDHTVQISRGRPDFTKAGWIKANHWMANLPGSTVFFPVVDVTGEYINVLFADFDREGLRVIDPATGGWAGLDRWVKNGYLTGPELGLLQYELLLLNTCVAAGHFKAQNIALACEALGLGDIVFSGFTPLVILGGSPFTQGLSFRFVTGKDGLPNPVGLDGHLEGHCPPYCKNMDQAIDDFLALRYGPQGILTRGYQGPQPFKDWEGFIGNAPRVSSESVQAAKDFCNYVYDRYGRFPAFIDAIQAPICVIVHHLDLDFYDQYYPSQVLTESHRRHMEQWH